MSYSTEFSGGLFSDPVSFIQGNPVRSRDHHVVHSGSILKGSDPGSLWEPETGGLDASGPALCIGPLGVRKSQGRRWLGEVAQCTVHDVVYRL